MGFAEWWSEKNHRESKFLRWQYDDAAELWRRSRIEALNQCEAIAQAAAADVAEEDGMLAVSHIAAAIRSLVAAEWIGQSLPEGGQLEIVGPDGVVLVCRPEGHPDIADALKRPGYSVRKPAPGGEEG